MSMVIEYERMKTGIVDHNLSLAEEPCPERRGGDSPGFMAECYLGQRGASRLSPSYSEWHCHHREHIN